jgi:hypothetical protein
VLPAHAAGAVPVMAARRLRAPQEHGAVLAEPPLADALCWLATPAKVPDIRIAGQSLQELRRHGVRSAWNASRDYLEAAGQGLTAKPPDRILAAGHQPELFHPGVWVKNFALNGLATRGGLAPLNLIVDNDSVKNTSLTLPAWSRESDQDADDYRLEKLAFDDWPGEVPYEEYQIHNEELFATLPRRASAWIHDWPFKPLLAEFWSEALRQRERTSLLGERLVAARRTLERRWGCGNSEVPVSLICETEPFAWFAAHLFANAKAFHGHYNEIVHEYRKANGLRSRNHPVPDLDAADDWRELPLWAWRAGARRRGRLFVRLSSNDRDDFEIRVDGQEWPRLPHAGPAFVEAWRTLGRQGLKIRSRALTTTLYMRLVVADSFIHGIGGAKYDELTDELMRRFFQVEPPRFIVLSATLLLPLKRFDATQEQERGLQHKLRDLHWNPQRHLPPDSPASNLVQARAELLRRRPALPPGGQQRHRALRQLTEKLRPFVAGERRQMQDALSVLEEQLQANAVIGRRDFPFCLFPEDTLRPFCQQFL